MNKGRGSRTYNEPTVSAIDVLSYRCLVCVIVMTFWYVFGTDLTFFELFKLYSSLGIDHDPHVLYVHMTYVYSFFLCFILHTNT